MNDDTADRPDRDMFHSWAAQLPATAIGHPGEQRARLTELVVAGIKTATTSLLGDYALEGEPVPSPGLYRLVDSDEQPVAIIEVTSVHVCRFVDVGDQHAHAEGEGDTDAAQWRETHRREWPTVDDDTEVVLERFRVIAVP